MIGAALALALALQAPAPRPADDPACGYDRAALLALDEQAFDQDLRGGWRALDAQGCGLAAADLIAAYRAAHPGARLTYLFFWHEGQLRADAGQTAAAAALFDRARRPETDARAAAWNRYVDGTIAFLRGDHPGLQAARDALAALPKPPDFDANLVAPDGKRVAMTWPMNLNVLDGLLRCFGRDYRTAYGASCTAPVFRYSAP